MNQILEQIYKIGIIPVIAIDDPDKAVPLAKALVKGGLPAAEITFRTQAAGGVDPCYLQRGSGDAGRCWYGYDQRAAGLCAGSGSKIHRQPRFQSGYGQIRPLKGALMLPGTATGGEMEQAMSMGLDAVKFFPAEQNGGIAKLKALAGPYRTLKWMPTGGINAKNLMDYLSFRPDPRLRRNVDGQKGHDRKRAVGRDHPTVPGGGQNHAGHWSLRTSA